MKKLISIIIVIAIVFGGVMLIKKKKEEASKTKLPTIYPVVIKTIKPKITKFRLTLTSLGIVQSGADVVVSTKLASRVLYIKPLGSVVKKGDVVVKLDSSSTQARILSAESNLKSLYAKLLSAKLSLKNMILTHKRTKKLLDINGASIEQYQKEADTISTLKSNISSIRSQISSLKATIKELKTLLGYTIIKSKINGIVSKKFVNTGDIASPGRPICEISSKAGKYILVRLPDSIAPKGIIYNNKIYKLFSLGGTYNGLNEYKANVKTTLNSGSRVEIGVIVFDSKAIKLPFDAVLNDNGNHFVLVVKKNRAKPQKVNIIANGEEGLAVSTYDIADKDIVVAKPDILIKLLGGVKVVKEQ